MKVLRLHMRKLKYNFKINLINYENISFKAEQKINQSIYYCKSKKTFDKISKNLSLILKNVLMLV